MLWTVGIPYKLFKTIPAKATILMSSPSLTSCLIIRTCSWVSWSLSVPDLHVRSIENCSCKFATGRSLKRGGDGEGNSCFKFKSPYTVTILSLFFEVSVVNQKYHKGGCFLVTACGNHCQFAFVLWWGYFSASFQSIVLPGYYWLQVWVCPWL